MNMVSEDEIERQLEKELPGISVVATIERRSLRIESEIPEGSPLELKPGKASPAVSGSVDDVDELKDEFIDDYFDNIEWESIPEEFKREYEKPTALPYSETTKELSRVFNVDLPDDWEDIGDLIGRSASYAERNKDEYGGPDGAFATKVRKEISTAVRMKRIRPHVCDMDKDTFGAALEFFNPIQRISLMRRRGEVCGDETAMDVLEVQLFGEPTAATEVERKGLIKWWYERDEAMDKLERVGYSAERSQEMIKKATGESVPETEKEESPSKKEESPSKKTVKKSIKEKMKEKMNR